MRKAVRSAALFFILSGCKPAQPPHPPWDTSQLERILSPEVQLTAIITHEQHGTSALQLTLRDVGLRTLAIDTGIVNYPLANFAFNLQNPDGSFRPLYCMGCAPASTFGQLDLYTITLKPSQAHQFTLPLSALVTDEIQAGHAMNVEHLHGRILIQLHVPTPPNAPHPWPGYVQTFAHLP